MTNAKETILIVEDDDGVALLQSRMLERAGFTAHTVGTERDALEFLATSHADLVILDYRLPGERTGLHLYADMQAAGHSVPVIVVTGFSDELTVIRALRAGVRDFVSKSQDYLTYLPEAVDRVLGQIRLERRLEDSEARFRSFMDNVPAITFIKDADGQILYANKRFESLFPEVVWRGKTEGQLFDRNSAENKNAVDCAAAPSEVVAECFHQKIASGGVGTWQTHSFPIEGTVGSSMTGVVAFEVGA